LSLSDSLGTLLIGISFVIWFFAVVSLRFAFTNLLKLGAQGFPTPRKFLLLHLAGLPIFAVVFTSGKSLPLIIFTTLLLAGFVLLVVGNVGGVMLGIWRVGSRCSSDSLRAAAILFVLPSNFIAAAFAIYGVFRARSRAP
jgi:hypothetical protein